MLVIVCIIVATVVAIGFGLTNKKLKEENISDSENELIILKKKCEEIDRYIKYFFNSSISYDSAINKLVDLYGQLFSINERVKSMYRKASRDDVVAHYNKLIEDFGTFGQNVSYEENELRPHCTYNNGNDLYAESAANRSETSTDEFVKIVQAAITAGDFYKIRDVNLSSLLECAWFYAIHEPFDEQAYTTTKKLFESICKDSKVQIHESKVPIDREMRCVAELMANSVGFNLGSILSDSNPIKFDEVYREMQDAISAALVRNNSLVAKSIKFDMSEQINKFSDTAELFHQIGLKLAEFIGKYPTILSEEYGRINSSLWQTVSSLDAGTVNSRTASWKNSVLNCSLNEILNIDFDLLIQYYWFYAVSKPYSLDKHKDVEWLMNKFSLLSYSEKELCSLYIQKSIGGESSIQAHLNDIIKWCVDLYQKQLNSGSSPNNLQSLREPLAVLASGLMWMQAYQSEKSVLQAMLNSNMVLTEQMQQRLHQLVNGGDVSVAKLNVVTDDESLYFDVSSLSWKDNEYNSLFENLIFQNSSLNYALAIRDEDKEMTIGKDIAFPGLQDIAQIMSKEFFDEYGDTATVRYTKCVAITGDNQEYFEGLLAHVSEYPHLGILFVLSKAGKKAVAKLYTMYIPTNDDLTTQKQRVLSLVNKLSPNISMWESGIKDTFILVLQKVFNQSGNSISPIDVIDSENLVF